MKNMIDGALKIVTPSDYEIYRRERRMANTNSNSAMESADFPLLMDSIVACCSLSALDASASVALKTRLPLEAKIRI